VDGAIHRAAGPKLLEECREIGGCPPGEARMTGGYELPARWVIHAVGPIWRGGAEGEPVLLSSAYTESLRLARRSELATIAFPAISTGAYGFPLPAATRIAVRAVGAWLVEHEWPRRVTFCCLRDEDASVYRAELAGL
jgi:O-acetyl-ADP-ribose deacetylase (regulator of RNase III)